MERRVRVRERSERKRDSAQQVLKVTTSLRPSPNPLPEGEGFLDVSTGNGIDQVHLVAGQFDRVSTQVFFHVLLIRRAGEWDHPNLHRKAEDDLLGIDAHTFSN